MALVNYLKILFESSWISISSFLWTCSNKVLRKPPHCIACHYWELTTSERLILITKTVTGLTCCLSVLMIFIIKGLNMIVIWIKYILVSSKDWIWGNRCAVLLVILSKTLDFQDMTCNCEKCRCFYVSWNNSWEN